MFNNILELTYDITNKTKQNANSTAMRVSDKIASHNLKSMAIIPSNRH